MEPTIRRDRILRNSSVGPTQLSIYDGKAFTVIIYYIAS